MRVSYSIALAQLLRNHSHDAVSQHCRIYTSKPTAECITPIARDEQYITQWSVNEDCGAYSLGDNDQGCRRAVGSLSARQRLSPAICSSSTLTVFLR
jgi:hypothetical protein